MGAIVGFLILIVGGLIYFAPSLIGMNRKGSAGIFALNLLLGWTLLGWVAALVWALAAPKVSRATPGSRMHVVLKSTPEISTALRNVRTARLLMRRAGEDAWTFESERGPIGRIEGEQGHQISFRAATIGAPLAQAFNFYDNGSIEVAIDFVPARAN